MSRDYELTLPVRPEDLFHLRVGARVYLTGEIVSSAGLPTYQRLEREAREGIEPPVVLQDGCIFHLGASLEEKEGGWHLHYLNPTTSTRFDPLMPQLIRAHKLLLTGGKGGLAPESAAALAETGGIYVSFQGGGAPILTDAVEEVLGVAWPELVSHYRIVRLKVKRLGPLTVGIDSQGNSLYQQIDEVARARREEILAAMSRERSENRAP